MVCDVIGPGPDSVTSVMSISLSLSLSHSTSLDREVKFCSEAKYFSQQAHAKRFMEYDCAKGEFLNFPQTASFSAFRHCLHAPVSKIITRSALNITFMWEQPPLKCIFTVLMVVHLVTPMICLFFYCAN